MKILIVDDEDINVVLLKVLLNKIGDIQLTVVNNGKDAIDICKDHYFNVILMDIRMPIMDGYEATKTIKKIRKNIPIVAVTTFPFDFIDKDYKEAGFDHYIQKPVKVDTLKKYLESIKN